MTEVHKTLIKAIKLGGKLCTVEETTRRRAICDGCPRSVDVDFFGEQVKGCDHCGCPHVTRLRMKWHILEGTVSCPDKKW